MTKSHPSRVTAALLARLAWAATPLAVAVLIGALAWAGQPPAEARTAAAPDGQTVPTVTPTPTPPRSAPDDTPPPSQPTDTPQPGQPTDTPRPGQPTDTPAPPGHPTSTPPPAPDAPPTATPLPPALAPAAPVAPGRCWAVPTPGFAPVRRPALAFEAQSDEVLIVPGQTLHLRLLVANRSNAVVRNVVVCNPLVAALRPAQPVASQGAVRLEPEGLIAELGDLAPGREAQVSVTLAVPADYPLGSVIENQAWLFAEGQQASTGLWTWALPPAWLPPTGRN